MNRDTLAINTLKINGVAAVNKANSGHPGIVLGAAPVMHTLYTRHMNYDPKNPKWINRDRFILSAGHGSALLYAQLRLLNLISEDNLKNFRQLNSITPGHPEYGMTKGVEATTGPLGQGLAMAVGIAVAEESLKARFKEINHHTYVLCGDGDLEEGVAMEALSFAGKQELKNLIILFDSNDIQLDTPVKEVFTDNMKMKIESMNIEYILVNNPSIDEIDKAIATAKKSNKPSFIEIKTIIGDGAPKAGTSAVHGAPLGEDIKVVKEKLEWTIDEFAVPKDVEELYKETIFKKGAKLFNEFKQSDELKKFLTKKSVEIKLDVSKNVATRASSGEVIKYLNDNVKNFIGGSADLAGSTKASGGDGVFSPTNRKGRNVLFGVREFAMAAMANGIALHSNFKPFVSTFFVFSDYAKPAMRLSALMKLPVIYVFTHDSIFVGEDGPTHEPIEQLAMLRSIPYMNVIRPADEKEVVGAYELAINATDAPTSIVLTRQNIKSLAETSKDKIKTGAYKLHTGKKDWTLVASGSELANALELAKELDISCVSISNTQNNIDWDTQKAITIEAATTFGLAKYGKYNFGIDRFGESAPGDLVYREMQLDIDSLREKITKLIK